MKIIGILVGIMDSAVGLKPCTITAGIETYQSISKKKEKQIDKMVLLSNILLNTIEVLI